MHNLRLNLLVLGIFLAGFLILAKLAFWQVWQAGELQTLARRQHEISLTLPARRGEIRASDGFPLANSREAYLLWAYLADLKVAPAEVANRLAPILAQDQEEVADAEKRILALLQKEGTKWVPLAHKISREQRTEIEKLKLEGIGFDLEEDREYAEASMAAHLLGFLGKDEAGVDRGYFGLEGYYDLTLAGASGELLREKDPGGAPILVGNLKRVAPLDGATLLTHLDRTIQYQVEKNLASGLKKYGALRGTVIVMRPTDGAILAMATLPAYDPAKFAESDREMFLNPAVGESFEPGSVFKILVMAAALDSQSLKLEEKCDRCAGPRQIAEYTIGTWNDKYYPGTNPTEIIQHSDNVGMIWVAEKLGRDKLYDYLVGFGLGAKTGIDLQDEAAPQLREREDWNVVDLAVSGFGQGIAVTPLQMLRATGTIANGGKPVTPQVVDKILTDGWQEDIKPELGERVLSEETAKKITTMMVNAVDNGEAKWAKPRGFAIAGKTGTAQIPVRGHYDEEKTIASFVGFAPADNPKFVMLVTLHEPTSSPWGSETAAPLWFSIARDLFPYLGIQPE